MKQFKLTRSAPALQLCSAELILEQKLLWRLHYLRSMLSEPELVIAEHMAWLLGAPPLLHYYYYYHYKKNLVFGHYFLYYLTLTTPCVYHPPDCTYCIVYCVTSQLLVNSLSVDKIQVHNIHAVSLYSHREREER